MFPAQGRYGDSRLDEVRLQRDDRDEGGVRGGWRQILSGDLRMDGARLSVGDGRGKSLGALKRRIRVAGAVDRSSGGCLMRVCRALRGSSPRAVPSAFINSRT